MRRAASSGLVFLTALLAAQAKAQEETFYTFSAEGVYSANYSDEFRDGTRLNGISVRIDRGKKMQFKAAFYSSASKNLEDDSATYTGKNDPVIGSTDIGRKEFDFNSRVRRREFIIPFNVNYLLGRRELLEFVDYHLDWRIDFQVGLALRLLQDSIRLSVTDRNVSGDVENPVHNLDMDSFYFLGIENSLNLGDRIRLGNTVQIDVERYRMLFSLGFRF